LRLQGTWTDKQMHDRVIPIYPPNFVCGGYTKIEQDVRNLIVFFSAEMLHPQEK